jgi:hypothetical protein
MDTLLGSHVCQNVSSPKPLNACQTNMELGIYAKSFQTNLSFVHTDEISSQLHMSLKSNCLPYQNTNLYRTKHRFPTDIKTLN